MRSYPKKHLGQNFLIDNNIISKIVEIIDPNEDDFILEIGPGQGAITTHLAKKARLVFAIEKDRELIVELKNLLTNVQLILMDALNFPWERGNNRFTKIVGNLPYNIATTLIFDIVPNFSHGKNMIFMVQKEVADKICAQVGTKNYGLLSVWVQTFCDTTKSILVKPTCFYPRPKVLSQVVILKPKGVTLSQQKLTKFKNTLKFCFNRPRKQLKSILKHRWNESVDEFFEQNQIDLKSRPNMLTHENYLQLSEIIS